VIGDRPLSELVPMYRDPRSDMPVTQFNMKWVEQAGLVKFDFLGLKTLTVLKTAVGFIAKRGITIDLEALPLDDKPTYEMLSRGETVGVFQVESAGMRKALIGMRPDRIEDIIALVALYRPGPMENIPVYNARKHGEEELASSIPRSTGCWRPTGRDRLPGAGDADRPGAGRLLARRSRPAAPRHGQEDQGRDGQAARPLRRRRGRARCLQAAGRHDLRPAGQVRNYGFNKSHAAAYGIVSYQTAYLKAHYPVEFLAASMTLDMSNTDKLVDFRQDARGLASRWCRLLCRPASVTSRPARTGSITPWPPSRASATPPSSTLSRSAATRRLPRLRISAPHRSAPGQPPGA
jgi:DNA polymerase-3 subunit alpha